MTATVVVSILLVQAIWNLVAATYLLRGAALPQEQIRWRDRQTSPI
jgi:hypothetical protein